MSIINIEFSMGILAIGLVFGLLYGLLVGLVFSLLFGFFIDLVGGLLFGSIWDLLFSLVGGLSFNLVFGLVGGLILGLLFGLIAGIEFSKKIISITNLQTPYQRLYGGFSVQVASNFLPIIVTIALVALLYYLLLNKYFDSSMKFGLLSLILLGFLFSFSVKVFSISILLHCYLRLCLWFEDSTPLKYATFLDLAAEARILEKDGGHWRFRHQTLQEHFAKLEI